METLEVKKANALTAYQQANEKGKKLLTNLFGKKHFLGNVIDRIETFDDILEERGISKEEFEKSCKGLTDDEIAYRQIKLIALVYNEGWVPDWNDSNQYKYYPWFKWVGSAAGCSFGDYFCDRSDSHLGSRLVFASSDLAIDAGKKFVEIYNRFLKP